MKQVKHKLCVVNNFAQKYREGIFKKIDEEWPCDWFFGENDTDIKDFEIGKLHRVWTVKIVRLKRHFYWMRGIVGLIRDSNYRNYLMLGELYCISTWVFLFLAKYYPKKRVYLWSHGWYGKESWLRRMMKIVYFGLADGTFLYGNYARQLMIEAGMNPNKLWVVHNSLNYDVQLKLRQQMQVGDIYRQHFGKDSNTLIFIGRLTAVKRLDLLIEAIIILRDRGEEYNLVFVGDGEKRTELEQRVREKNLTERVWFYGACYDEKANAELIYNADLCVAPGNVGLTAMHTMMFGCPVLTHNCFEFQMPEFEAIHEGNTGAFFDRGSSASLADAISLWFLQHPASEREKVRCACYEEIDSQWTPQFQLSVMKSVLDERMK